MKPPFKFNLTAWFHKAEKSSEEYWVDRLYSSLNEAMYGQVQMEEEDEEGGLKPIL